MYPKISLPNTCSIVRFNIFSLLTLQNAFLHYTSNMSITKNTEIWTESEKIWNVIVRQTLSLLHICCVAYDNQRQLFNLIVLPCRNKEDSHPSQNVYSLCWLFYTNKYITIHITVRHIIKLSV